VTNPSLEKEFDILKRSGVYTLSVDSVTATKIQLKPLQLIPGCGTPLVGTILTLGLFPGATYDQYRFSYSETTGSSSADREILIVLRIRLSLYEFLRGDDERDALAEGLRSGLKEQ
jgi:hypothetical protein